MNTHTVVWDMPPADEMVSTDPFLIKIRELAEAGGEMKSLELNVTEDGTVQTITEWIMPKGWTP